MHLADAPGELGDFLRLTAEVEQRGVAATDPEDGAPARLLLHGGDGRREGDGRGDEPKDSGHDGSRERRGRAPNPQYTEYHGKVDEERPERTPERRKQTVRDAARRAAFAKFEAMGTFAAVGSVGLSFVLALIIGSALGWWLDNITGWRPLFFIVFFLLGLVAGIRNVYITTKKFLK